MNEVHTSEFAFYETFEQMDLVKFCPGCGKWFCKNRFSKDKRIKGGLARKCKVCKSAEWVRNRRDRLAKRAEAAEGREQSTASEN